MLIGLETTSKVLDPAGFAKLEMVCGSLISICFELKVIGVLSFLCIA